MRRLCASGVRYQHTEVRVFEKVADNLDALGEHAQPLSARQRSTDLCAS
jgi:hypothetical protein